MQTIYDTGVFILIWYKTVKTARMGRSNVKTLIVAHGLVYYRYVKHAGNIWEEVNTKWEFDSILFSSNFAWAMMIIFAPVCSAQYLKLVVAY